MIHNISKKVSIVRNLFKKLFTIVNVYRYNGLEQKRVYARYADALPGCGNAVIDLRLIGIIFYRDVVVAA